MDGTLDLPPRDDDSSEVLGYHTVLPDLVHQLIRLGWELDALFVKDDTWGHALRILYQINALGGYRLVTVAGGAGAGKTTLVNNVYPTTEGWLEPNPGRGEKNPIAVVETADCREPRGVVIRRGVRPRMVSEEYYGRERLDEWGRILRGEDNRVLMIRLEVPLLFWGVDGTGFLLLPGFERLADDHWQVLMRVVLDTSPAVVLVTDAGRMADAAQREIVDVRRAGLAGSRPVEVVVALNRSEGKSRDALDQHVEWAEEVYGVAHQNVVPIGSESDDPAGWLSHFARAVKGILPSATYSRQQEVDQLRNVITSDVAHVIDLGYSTRDRITVDRTGIQVFNNFVEVFDQQVDQILTTLDHVLESASESTTPAPRRS